MLSVIFPAALSSPFCLHTSEVKLLGQVIQLAVAVEGLTAGVLTSFPALCPSKLFYIPPGSGQVSMQRL